MKVDIALEPEWTASELGELSQLAERYGIETLWVTNDTQARDLFMLYARIAELTSRIRLGVMAVTPLEIHPLKMAAALNTLNELSNGRAAIVVGGGGAIMAHTKIDLSRRVGAVKDCIAILKDAGTGKSFKSDSDISPVWRYQNAWAVEPPPCVLAGANRPQMLRMSARRADGIHMSDLTVEMVAEAVAIVSATLAKYDRTPEGFEFNNFWAFHVKEDGNEAELEARSRLVLRGLLMPQYIEPFLDAEEVQLVRGNMESFYQPFYDRQKFLAGDGAIENVPEETVAKLVRNLTLTASTADLDSQLGVLHDFAAAGLTHVTLGLHDNPAAMIKLIGERVIPALK
jgi:alkanesulfonate monooxygenase SsuD/methylene tetrahydromethanopterin reductase-like flavin-dependent oxidoreductase (luciferase family)